MDFLKFFKRRENSLDIPPPPPPIGMRTEHPLTPKNDLPLPEFNVPLMKQEGGLNTETTKEELSFPELPPLPDTPIHQPEEEFNPFKQEPEVINPIFEQRPQEVKEAPKETIKIKEGPREQELVDEKRFLDSPLFVKTNQYQNMINGISVIKNKINECDFIVKELNNIKNRKDKEFGKWRSNLEGMQRKVSLVEKALFEVAK